MAKHDISHRLSPGGSRQVIGPLAIIHVHNQGIALGFVAASGTVMAVLTLLALCVTFVLFASMGRRSPAVSARVRDAYRRCCCQSDRRLHAGAVTDFLHLGSLPAFNFADAFVVAGVITILLCASRREGRSAPQQ